MAIIQIRKQVALDAPIQVDNISGVTFTGEADAHQFVIACTRGGEAVNLHGTVTGKFIRANGTTIEIAGDNAYADGGKAFVTLPQDCYNVQGRFQLSVFVTEGDYIPPDPEETEDETADATEDESNISTICVYSCVGTVQRSQTGTIVDGGAIIPTVETLISQIQTAVDFEDKLHYLAMTPLNRALFSTYRKNMGIANGRRLDLCYNTVSSAGRDVSGSTYRGIAMTSDNPTVRVNPNDWSNYPLSFFRTFKRPEAYEEFSLVLHISEIMHTDNIEQYYTNNQPVLYFASYNPDTMMVIRDAITLSEAGFKDIYYTSDDILANENIMVFVLFRRPTHTLEFSIEAAVMRKTSISASNFPALELTSTGKYAVDDTTPDATTNTVQEDA